MSLNHFYQRNKKIVDSIIISSVPTLVSTVILRVITKEGNLLRDMLITGVSYAFMVIVVVLVRTVFFRPYKEYEGRWIEYIPNFERPFSICELKHRGGEYHFSGLNYDDNYLSNYVDFFSYDFICSSEDMFTYYTKSNSKSDCNGFGKVYAFTRNATGFFVAKGFFVDISNKHNPQIQHTRMIKWDGSFFNREEIKRLLPQNKPAKDLTDVQIIDCLKFYISDLFKENNND